MTIAHRTLTASRREAAVLPERPPGRAPRLATIRHRWHGWHGWHELPLREVALAWLAARIVTGAAYALAHYVSGQLDAARPAGSTGMGLTLTGPLGWDAGWYSGIAEHGYAGSGEQSLRFFPLLPLLVRAVTVLPGLGGHTGTGVALVVLVNLTAFAFVTALARLARHEGFDPATVSRVIWLTSLAPPAFVLVMGYTEALWGLLAVGVFAGIRTRRWELAAACGLFAGLCRPVGILLIAPVALEAARGITAAGATDRLRRAVAVMAPAAGLGGYLLWARIAYGDALAPIRLQRQQSLHGSSSNPAEVIWNAARGISHGEVGTALHVPWLMLVIALLVVMIRTLPASYPVWAALTVAAVLTGSNLDSSERYAYGAFPFLFVAAAVTLHDEMFRIVLTACAAMMVVYASLAFLGLYIP
ncbi:mannosyltransferase family protein [Protofrankia symbiont of Coriaria ruscifolia]|uniref:mannosyltransferase family protein n=1 Tax=Protofrankia symbiont of Coriaria ruscifolia TaxID=1306542 RepID=UPI001041088E|nr:mannosyltransferase family protein [Protofrankia symbiont of Coriaria ruscifolia]